MPETRNAAVTHPSNSCTVVVKWSLLQWLCWL